jgi:type I restriction enzyme, R subunit
MSQLLDALIEQRRQAALDYQKYLQQIVELTKKIKNPTEGSAYPTSLDTSAKRAFYDNFGRNEKLALAIDSAILACRQDDWRGNIFKVRRVKNAIKAAIESFNLAMTGKSSGFSGEQPAPFSGKGADSIDSLAEQVLELAKKQHDY